MKERVRDTDLRVLSELMINGRISDRALAQKIDVSQPTVSRIRAKLEKEGYIQEYTAIPNLAKLRYEILAFTFIKLRELPQAKIEEARSVARSSLGKDCFNIVMLERGIGLSYDGIAISYHENYRSYLDLLAWFRQFEFLDVSKIDSYLVSLQDTIRYKPLTFKTLAQHVVKLAKRESPE